MRHIVDIVDSHEYANSNCFVHQLTKEIESVSDYLSESDDLWVETMSLSEFLFRRPKADQYLSRLKQRTIRKNIKELSTLIGKTPIVIYDQDPWEAFRDDSPYKGTYKLILDNLNVKFFAITTKWWVDFLERRDIPSKFVKMGVLPEYCNVGKTITERSTLTGFIGSIHGYRQQLFDQLNILKCPVDVQKGGLSYNDYLDKLSNIGFFIHREDYSFFVDNQLVNLDTGLWVKDIEAISRGCFSIRNKGEDSETYLNNVQQSLLLYDNISDIPKLIEKVLHLKKDDIEQIRFESVQNIINENSWRKMAFDLVL